MRGGATPARAFRSTADRSTFSNPGLIRYLIDNYYRDGAEPNESEFVSPIWRQLSELYEVEFDDDGWLVSLRATGFGSGRWETLRRCFADSLCVLTHLIHLPHRRELVRLTKFAAGVCRAMDLDPTFNVFRQACSLELIARHLPSELLLRRMRFLMIGDGHGVLASLIKRVFPNTTIFMIDIGKTLLFQAHYCQKAHPDCRHELVHAVTDSNRVDFVYCPTEHLEQLERFKFDVAVNISSFQEMNSLTRERYFTFLRRHLESDHRFYCCNRESRTDFGVETRFVDYPWREGDRHLVDEACPWHRYYFGRRSSDNPLRLCGVTIPFVRLLDDVKLRHRITILERS